MTGLLLQSQSLDTFMSQEVFDFLSNPANLSIGTLFLLSPQAKIIAWGGAGEGS
jgi:hypothetical protein